MASGNGSNFQALCDAISDGRIPNASIVRLIVNRGKAYATTRAESKGIPWEYFNLISHGFQEKGEKVNYTHKEITSDMWVGMYVYHILEYPTCC